MIPINEFLASKEMTAINLLELTGAEESAFWDEYQLWRRSKVDEVAEKAKELDLYVDNTFDQETLEIVNAS